MFPGQTRHGPTGGGPGMQSRTAGPHARALRARQPRRAKQLKEPSPPPPPPPKTPEPDLQLVAELVQHVFQGHQQAQAPSHGLLGHGFDRQRSEPGFQADPPQGPSPGGQGRHRSAGVQCSAVKARCACYVAAVSKLLGRGHARRLLAHAGPAGTQIRRRPHLTPMGCSSWGRPFSNTGSKGSRKSASRGASSAGAAPDRKLRIAFRASAGRCTRRHCLPFLAI